MNIGFNLLCVGMGNNGGTRTLLKCVETLKGLGHNAYMLAAVDNFKWFEHEAPLRGVPDNLDVIIAASCYDVESTLSARVDKKAWYIRAHEDWLYPDHTLGVLYNKHTINLVNSVGLQNKLLTFGAESEVIYQGIDLDLWYNEYLRPEYIYRIGCLHTTQSRKRWKDFVKLHDMLGDFDYEYVGIGSSVPKDASFLKEFKCNASPEELRELYSSCHFWFAPTENEGLHNVPMEASLCGALVVCSDNKDNGMVSDYAFDSTAMIYRFGHLDEAVDLIRDPDWPKTPAMQEYIENVIGSREDNMIKLVNYLK